LLQDTTPLAMAAAYEAIVGLGDSADLAQPAARMRIDFQRRTGAFGPEDPWFEARARAFWDDAVTTQGFGVLAAPRLGRDGADRRYDDAAAIAACLLRAHRGFFLVDDVNGREATLLDVWSGAELVVSILDEAQALMLEHAEGAMDARVAAGPRGERLFLLPGAYHHVADTVEPATRVLVAAQERGMSTQQALDALMRMDLVLRSSSRVKTSFAYRVESLGPAVAAATRGP
jgi:hypothetical protein